LFSLGIAFYLFFRQVFISYLVLSIQLFHVYAKQWRHPVKDLTKTTANLFPAWYRCTLFLMLNY